MSSMTARAFRYLTWSVTFKPKNRSVFHTSTEHRACENFEVKYTKYLGIYIDEELSWKYHINHIASKISKMTGIMAKARYHLTSKILLTLYHIMIYPYLNYCNIIWGSTYPTRLHSIYKIQKKIVRIMTFSNDTEETRPLFESLAVRNIPRKGYTRYVTNVLFPDKIWKNQEIYSSENTLCCPQVICGICATHTGT